MEFQRHAAENQWQSRKERGYPHHTDIFYFIYEVYGSWLDGTMDRVDLKEVDPKAWAALNSKVKTYDVPDWLNLPRACDKNLPSKGTPQYDQYMQARAQNAERMRTMRAIEKGASTQHDGLNND